MGLGNVNTNINTDGTNENEIQYRGIQYQHREIVDIFLKAAELRPSDPDIHIVLGVLFNITSDYSRAEYHFKRAIKQRPNDPSLWNKLGATMANNSKCNDAIKAYSKALQLKPNYVRALSNLGISFANQVLSSLVFCFFCLLAELRQKKKIMKKRAFIARLHKVI